jgi:hypothetical protein
MATLTVQTLPANGEGATISFAAADVAGDDFVSSNDVELWVQFGAAPSGAVQVDGITDPYGNATQRTISATATTIKAAGPFAPAAFNDAGGSVNVSYPSGITDINVAAVKRA